ncbi:MarR family transcriptional regulator [Niastella yeongjuensis]|uniref:MarR family transcriptional regulator n=1 Tax=Niastella yeongjuensis TaxID=354355 RepID=A0A1V9F817_9BACT|nr:winged helix-turn-helix transcriptional regulator [Niastella yeongjuensis]OQP54560.1 MarR family transcriptional regulator [Niastella yeongjuensis]SEN98980.1 transcriptional regulator, HxlR family [Niastella yeongjuensis]
MGKKKSEKIDDKCTIHNIMEILGGKWAIPIIYNLCDNKKRFGELERRIPNINTRMLVKELKSLEKNRIVKREAFATVPPTVEYSLTEKGKALEPIILGLLKWGQEYANNGIIMAGTIIDARGHVSIT